MNTGMPEVLRVRSPEEREEEEERRERERYKTRQEIIGKCRCEGNIVVEISFPFDPDSDFGSMRVGSPSAGRVERRECFCEKCGLLYKADVVKKGK